MTTWSMPAGSGDRWPDDYERGRPGWPPEALALPGLPAGATLLDPGAGTGKLTRLLLPAFRRAVAVEPAQAMRRLLVAACPEPEVVAGTGRELPLAFYASMAWLADLPDGERLPLLDRVRSLLPATAYRRRRETQVHRTRLLPGG